MDQPIVFSVVLTLLLALLFAAVAAALMLRRQTSSDTDRKSPSAPNGLDTLVAWPPESMRVLSPAERTAHDLLVRALPSHMIFAQLPLSRFVKVQSRYPYAQWLRRVGSHCVDLAVADPLSRVIAVIEVDALNTPRKSSAKHREVTRVLKDLRIPLYQWREGELPGLDQLRDLFQVADDEMEKTVSLFEAKALSPTPIDPATVSFYIANEALPEADREGDIEEAGLCEVANPTTESVPAAALAAFEGISLDLPPTSLGLPPATPTASEGLPAEHRPAPNPENESVLVEHMIYNDPEPELISSSARNSGGVEGAAHAPASTTWHGEADSQLTGLHTQAKEQADAVIKADAVPANMG